VGVTKLIKLVALDDHVATCTGQVVSKKTRDETLINRYLFHTTTRVRVKTQQVVRSRGQRCGVIELTVYLADAVVLVNLVMPTTWTPETHTSVGGVSQTLCFMTISTIHFLLT
jgi:hypothetical protein